MSPERFIPAGFGGLGIREPDPALAEIAAGFDRSGPAPEGAATAAFEHLSRQSTIRAEGAGAASAAPSTGSTGAAGSIGAAGSAVATVAATGPGAPPATGGSPALPALDLTDLSIPIVAINGEYDAPYAQSLQMWREVEIFQNVILPGHNQMSAIMIGGPMPQRCIESIVGFIAAHDEAP